jgi:hypothetical protein
VSVTETVLVFAGIPVAIVLVISGLAMVGGSRGAKRYRPGRSFTFAPVWFLSAPEQLAGNHASSDHAALPAGTTHAALPAGTDRAALPAGDGHAALPATTATATAAPARIGPTGGASDRW